MANAETLIQQRIRLAIGRVPDLVLWRNPVGFDERAGQRYGLTVGASDLIGCLAGRFFALEVKTPSGRPSKEQLQFLQLVRDKGGFSAIVRSPEEAMSAVQRAREGASE